jgi:hypothetical protein
MFSRSRLFRESFFFMAVLTEQLTLAQFREDFFPGFLSKKLSDSERLGNRINVIEFKLLDSTAFHAPTSEILYCQSVLTITVTSL